MGDKVARKITYAMATWTFAGLFLLACIFELWWNHSALINSNFKFDQQTIILNLFLSLIAAIQGSIIMIAQKQQDKDRDEMMKAILEMSKKLLHLEENQENLEKQMVESLKRIEEGLNELK